jgi:hypothetical protein
MYAMKFIPIFFLAIGLNKLTFLMSVRKVLVSHFDYDNSIDGLIGETYAEIKLGMVKAKSRTEGIDGHINGRSVQVKTKGGIKEYKDSEHYIEINPSHKELIDDLLMVFIKKGELSHVGPIALSRCTPKIQTSGRLRIYLQDMNNQINASKDDGGNING